MTNISTVVGKNPLEEMEEPSQSTNNSKMQYLGAILKMTEWSLFVSEANHSVSVIQVYAPTTNVEEAEIKNFYDDMQTLLELTPKKKKKKLSFKSEGTGM